MHIVVEDEEIPCCLASTPTAHGILAEKLPGYEDAEGAHVDGALPAVVDTHVHLFPDGLFDAIWRWFETWGWPIRYRLYAREVLDHQFSRGVRHVVGLTYAHKPGIARMLNTFMAELAASEPRLTALGTVFPCGIRGGRSCGCAVCEGCIQALGGVLAPRRSRRIHRSRPRANRACH